MSLPRQCRRLAPVVAVATIVTGCAAQTTSSVTGQGLYPRLAVVAFLVDSVRGEWNDGTKKKTYGPTQAGWDTRRVSAEIVRDMLERVGTKVVPVLDAENYLEKADLEAGPDAWPGLVVRRLRDAGRIEDAEAVLLLRQNAIDAMGREYSPAAMLWWGGFIGAIVAEATKEERYFPSYLVAINVGLHKVMIGRSRCMVDFDAHLFDVDGQNVTARSFGLLGSYIVPEELWAPSFEEYSEAEKRDLQARCQFALRKALADGMVRLGLARRD